MQITPQEFNAYTVVVAGDVAVAGSVFHEPSCTSRGGIDMGLRLRVQHTQGCNGAFQVCLWQQ